MPDSEQADFVKRKCAQDSQCLAIVLQMLEEQTHAQEDFNLRDLVSASASDFLKQEKLLKAGDMIERFEVLKSIGEGGMGSVFLGSRKQDDFEQLVAIKVIHLKYTSMQSLERFRRERQILASLNHKNIASFIGGGETEQGQPYIILEYVDGVPITQYCEEQDLSIAKRLELFKQVVEAVIYAHQNLIVHRDIKPSNVLVNSQGEVKLLDFGIAKLIQSSAPKSEDKQDLTQEFARVLTPANASPEQVLGSSITTRSDVYGLGALLMYLVTGEALFDTTSSSPRSIESMIIEQQPAKPSVKCSASPNQSIRKRTKLLKGDIDTIVMKALQKEPDRRYSSSEQLLEDIERHQRNYPISAKPDSFLYRAKKFVQRNTFSTALVSLFVFGLISTSSIIFWQSLAIERERDRALRQAFVAQETAKFMTDIFQSADPNQNAGGEISVKSIIDKASENLVSLDSEPFIKAQLNTTLGSVYSQIGEYELAATMLARAGQYFAQSQSDPFNPSYASFQYVLGNEQANNLILIGEYLEPLARFQSLAETLESDRSPGLSQALYDYYYAQIQYGIGTAQTYNANDSLALVHYQNSVTRTEQIIAQGGQYSKELAYALADRLFALGHSLRQTGQFERSKEVLKRGVENQKALDMPPSLSLAHGLNQLASTLLQLGQLEQAEQYAIEGLNIRKSMLEFGHVEVMASTGMLANIYAKQKKFARSIDMRLEMLDMVEGSLGQSHPYYPIVQRAIGQVYVLAGDLNNAQFYLDESYQRALLVFPDGHQAIALSLVQLSDLSLRKGDIQNALQQSSDALAMLNANSNQASQSLAKANLFYAEALYRNMQASLAIPYETLGLNMIEELYGKDGSEYDTLYKRIQNAKLQ